MRIAVVGAGISGLTCAYYLSRRHEVTVFEASDRVGGHADTTKVRVEGQWVAVDTGFVVFNEVNYPLFTRLLRKLDVETQPASMSFSVRSDLSGIEYNGSSINGLFCQRRNLARPRFLGMLRDIARFQREAPALAEAAADDTSVESFVTDGKYGRGFVENYLLPLGSALWSVPQGTFRQFPIRLVVEFLGNHGMLRWSGRPAWRVIRGGASRYVKKLSQPFAQSIVLKAPVAAIKRHAHGVRVIERSGAAGEFDHVVLACHADQALLALQPPSNRESRILRAFPYQQNDAVLHTDPEPLPKRRRAWASWNYRVRSQSEGRATVTYNMNRLQGIPTQTLLNVTLNDFDGIEEGRILKRMRYEHPVFTSQRARAQDCHRELIDTNRTSFCGAYWGYGFHEDGVRSAVAVCRALDPESLK